MKPKQEEMALEIKYIKSHLLQEKKVFKSGLIAKQIQAAILLRAAGMLKQLYGMKEAF